MNIKENYLNKLQVKNFRNLENNIFEFSDGINCIFGQNGNGKTNVLESIYYLFYKKSFRKNISFPQILSIDGDKPEIYISALLTEQADNKSISLKIENKIFSYAINGRPVKNKDTNLELIFIDPFAGNIFHNSSQARRDWFDQHFSMVDQNYKKLLGRYEKSLKIRNKLLSDKPNKYLEQLKAVDNEFIKLNFELTIYRKKLLSELNPFISKNFKEIFDEEHQIEFSLDSNFVNPKIEEIERKLQENLEKDLILGYSTKGVHKDDYLPIFDGYNALEFCSLGQQKMTYFSLLFAYISLFRLKSDTFPIVLMDDVSGELDELRWKRLVNFLKKQNFQIIATTANSSFMEELNKIQGAKLIRISQGSIV